MQLYHTALVIVVLATLGVSVPSSAIDIIESVVKKLDELANNVRLVSGISRKELVGMVDEWKELPEDEKAAKLEVPEYKLLYHFGILPTKRIRDELDDDVVLSVAHINQLEEAYKRFLPGYKGKQIGDCWLESMHATKLVNILNKLKYHKPCTLKDFELFDIEHKMWLARYEEIVYNEDVYSNLIEMKNILNYHNRDVLKPMFEHVLPLLGKVNDPAVLQQLYYDKLYENWKIRFNENGAVVQYID